jgi:two-component system response regulator MprA
VAPEGRAAIEQLALFSPHVLVLDVMLPHIDGWEVLARSQELPANQRPKVILVSAIAGVSDQARAQDLGVGSFLAKPFEMDELIRLVGEALQAA